MPVTKDYDTISDTFVADEPVAFHINRLVQTSTLADKVVIDRRDSVVLFAVKTDFPVTMWSTGEQRLWSFLTSLTGQGEVNLGLAANYLAGGSHAPHMVAAFAVLMGESA
jgi:hypothetical protein